MRTRLLGLLYCALVVSSCAPSESQSQTLLDQAEFQANEARAHAQCELSGQCESLSELNRQLYVTLVCHPVLVPVMPPPFPVRW